MPSKPVPSVINERLIAALRRYGNAAKAARLTGVSQFYARKMAMMHGIPLRSRHQRHSLSERQYVTEAVGGTQNCALTAAQLGLSPSYVRSIARTRKISLKHGKRSYRYTDSDYARVKELLLQDPGITRAARLADVLRPYARKVATSMGMTTRRGDHDPIIPMCLPNGRTRRCEGV